MRGTTAKIHIVIMQSRPSVAANCFRLARLPNVILSGAEGLLKFAIARGYGVYTLM